MKPEMGKTEATNDEMGMILHRESEKGRERVRYVPPQRA